MDNRLKILFVLPGFSMAGTTASLSSMLSSKFAILYDIDIFTINKRAYNPEPLASYDIGLNGLTTAYNSDFSTFHGFDKLKYLPVKLLKQIKPLAKYLERWVVKTTIRRIERRKKYDFVVGFQEEDTTRFTRFFNCPRKIAWIHCDYAKSYGKEVNELELYDLYSRIVCVSEFTRKGFVERYPSLAQKTVAIHNIFDAKSVVAKSKEPIEDARFDNSVFTIISLGRISEVKRFYLIPEIAAVLKRKDVSFRWYILGNTDGNSDLKKLTDAIKQYDVSNEVIYLGGKPNPYPYLKASDLMVSVSKSEACPMIFNEAKLLIVPILSSDFGSAFEFIAQGINGYITTISDMPGKLLELVSNPDTLASIKSNNDFFDTNKEILNQLSELFS